MNIQSEKLELINWLTGLNDQNTIEKIKALRNEKVRRPKKLSKEERAEIEEGKKDIKAGRYFTHEEVMEDIENRFANLLK